MMFQELGNRIQDCRDEIGDLSEHLDHLLSPDDDEEPGTPQTIAQARLELAHAQASLEEAERAWDNAIMDAAEVQ